MKAEEDTEQLELGDSELRRPQRTGASPRGVVSAQHHLATDAGVEMLELGGNAFDAAVAAALALAVCEPNASGLGGQTMVLLYRADTRTVIALDGSSRAPNRATPELLTGRERRQGYRATTVPSTPAVLSYLLERHGRLSRKQVLAPAIRLARDGYPISELQRALTRRELKSLRAGSAAPFFLRDGHRTYPAGTLFQQPVLAETLDRLSRKGFRDFYKGQVAREIHADMQRNGGLLHLDDLARIPFPIERRPLTCRFLGRKIYTFPPPGAGRTLVEMLNILEQFSPRRRDPDTPEGALLLVEVIRQAYLDRQDRPVDPSFYPQVKNKKMLSASYAREVARKIRGRIRSRIRTHGETTHLSIMDAEGNVVALTQSIERVYGSFAATPTLGFLYNNYMSAYEYEDISHPYYLRPNAAPWASVAPTLVFTGRTPWMAIGSPGSERITSSIVQVLLRLERQSPFDAVAAPRLHCSTEGKVSLEASRFRDDLVENLERHGFELDRRDPFSFYLGCVQLAMRSGKTFVGVADPRRDGAARGPRH